MKININSKSIHTVINGKKIIIQDTKVLPSDVVLKEDSSLREVVDMISKGKTAQAINCLKSVDIKEIEDALVILESSFHRVKNDKVKMVTSNELYERQLNIINSNLLSLIKQIS